MSLEEVANQLDAYNVSLYPYQRELMKNLSYNNSSRLVQQYYDQPNTYTRTWSIPLPSHERNDDDLILDYANLYTRKNSVIERVLDSKNDFIFKWGINPNSLFVNHDDYNVLRTSNEYMLTNLDDLGSIFGMKVNIWNFDNPKVGLIE
ncbi:hypothetical protein ABFV99_13760 [Cytobacillus horneckiae]|uniref:hypothetical protein n=1 Tax=Cytobacillus horneckiae TaxID=549687 RepID=UPI0034CD55A7